MHQSFWEEDQRNSVNMLRRGWGGEGEKGGAQTKIYQDRNCCMYTVQHLAYDCTSHECMYIRAGKSPSVCILSEQSTLMYAINCAWPLAMPYISGNLERVLLRRVLTEQIPYIRTRSHASTAAPRGSYKADLWLELYWYSTASFLHVYYI